HNPLEPAAYGLPVLMGPHTFNFAQICQQLEEAGGLTRVSDAHSLQQAVTERLQQPELAARQGKQALTFMQQNQGALSRLLTLLDTALSGSEK
ncbi:MAG: 3-deoxy-D-manno-octulosonic acid transferase, partial [Plesiomonas shigelloides]